MKKKVKNQTKKKSVINKKDEMSVEWRHGYLDAIRAVRTKLTLEYNRNPKTVTRRLLEYLYRPIDLDNTIPFRSQENWTKENLD